MNVQYISFVFLLILYKTMGHVDPTLGFVSQPLDGSNFDIQKPYDIAVGERYTFVKGTHKLWVYNTDKPFKISSNTLPRTEIRIQGYDYSSGVWQFEAFGYVPYGTSGVSIMQIFGSDPPSATTTMLRVYNNSLCYYRHPILSNIYDKWLRINVIHDVDGNSVTVFIDGTLTYQTTGRGGKSHYFKLGVYTQDNSSFCMESRWKDIKILKHT
ncbi:hypothetical protein QVD17_31345 [Tagetes erecta]|uniref:Alginate lyase 2 domain-containing protein n=1 Tax=Tagetes erecta TaxID=13708 RepID=A0AAD8NNS7_TARER|nr:hypothetical protein QVD17_31345 [Tagetes erecta]